MLQQSLIIKKNREISSVLLALESTNKTTLDDLVIETGINELIVKAAVSALTRLGYVTLDNGTVTVNKDVSSVILLINKDHSIYQA